MTFAARWPSPQLLEPIRCQPQGSMRHSRLIRGALMVGYGLAGRPIPANQPQR
jgi:hypothetical protein